MLRAYKLQPYISGKISNEAYALHSIQPGVESVLLLPSMKHPAKLYPQPSIQPPFGGCGPRREAE